MARPRRSADCCSNCGQRMRFSYQPDTEGTVLAGADNLCNTCYKRRWRSEGTQGQPSAVQAAAGDVLELVRWTNSRDGWTYELVAGRYAGRDRDTLTLVIDGAVRTFDRSEWEVCAA